MRMHAANGKPFRFQTESEIFTPDGVSKIEELYAAKFVFESCVKGKHGWVNMPVAIFYQSEDDRVPDGGPTYFAMYPGAEPGSLIISNGISATEPFEAVIANDGEVVWSRHRHDYRYSNDGSVWVDGGRDYLRYSGKCEAVEVRVQVDHLEVI